MNLNAEQIKDSCKGEFLVEPLDTTVFATCIKIDSRKVECGDLFVAFKGENVDGHDYIESALDNKASVIVCEKDVDDKIKQKAKDYSASVIKVSDAQRAVIDIATTWRANLMGKIVGITGSVGKTTVKKLVYECLSTKYQTTANDGNYNNQIGLPMTICKADFEDDFIVTEMGMSKLGEIKELCDIAQPEWGLITNVGQAHMEFLGSQENIAKAKGELAEAIPNNIGVMFMPTDDAYTNYIIDLAMLRERSIEIVYFGSDKYHDNLDAPQVWYEDLCVDKTGKSNFTICVKSFDNIQDSQQNCKFNLSGKFNAVNACAAVAVSLKAGLSLLDIIKVLEETQPEHGRFEVFKAKEGFSIINDAYNASPQSMKASVEVFSNMELNGKKILFLGDMFELGSIEESGHIEVGEFIASMPFDYLICVGKLSKHISAAAKKAGMSEDKISQFENINDAKDKLLEIIDKDDVVLMKASNSMKFQDLALELRG